MTRAPLATGVLVIVAGGVNLGLWFFELRADVAVRQDPVLSFFLGGRVAQSEVTAESLKDMAAARGYRVPEAFKRKNVIIISVDCLRADHLSAYGYGRETMPFLSGLLREGRARGVEFAISNGNDSPAGIFSMLSSLPPERHGVHNFKLPDVLKKAGYRTHLVASGDHTALSNLRRYYGPNFDVFADGLSRSSHSVNDDEGIVHDLKAMPGAGGGPAFFFIHLMSSHTLAVRSKDFARWQPAYTTMDWDGLILGNFDPVKVANAYDNGLLQADEVLGRIMGVLKEKGFLEDYVAVIAGDHGEVLGEHGQFGHGRQLYMGSIRVPICFMDSEGGAGFGALKQGSQIDIAPTLLARLGLPVPETWSGRDLATMPAPERMYATGRRPAGWRTMIWQEDGRRMKYHFYAGSAAKFSERVFDLTLDPGEDADLHGTMPADRMAWIRAEAAAHFGETLPPIN